MDPEFWLERWRNGHLGFHQGETNRALMSHWPALDAPSGSRVFVPLCGKSLDMVWLAGQGHAVVGAELSEIAVTAFFEILERSPEVREEAGFTVYTSGPYEIWCGDYFALPPEVTADIGAIYDRASLIALPPEMRPAYATQMSALNTSGAPALLLTIEYDQAIVAGPPHSVGRDEVDRLFSDWEIAELQRGTEQIRNPRFVDGGLPVVTGVAYRLRPRSTGAA